MGGCTSESRPVVEVRQDGALQVLGTDTYIKILGADPMFPFVKEDHNLQDVLPFFTKERVLGQGASCEVRHVTRKIDGQEYAMKIMKRDDKWNPILFKQEYELLTVLKHPNILGYRDCYMDPTNFYV